MKNVLVKNVIRKFGSKNVGEMIFGSLQTQDQLSAPMCLRS